MGGVIAAVLMVFMVPFNYFGIKVFGKSTVAFGIVKLFFYIVMERAGTPLFCMVLEMYLLSSRILSSVSSDVSGLAILYRQKYLFPVITIFGKLGIPWEDQHYSAARLVGINVRITGKRQ